MDKRADPSEKPVYDAGKLVLPDAIPAVPKVLGGDGIEVYGANLLYTGQ